MKYIRSWVGIGVMSWAILMQLLVPFTARAASPSLVISELQTAAVGDGNQEFVELYNPTDSSVVVDGWTIGYASSAARSWSVKSTLSGEVAAHGFYLASTADGADAALKSGLAASGGQVRLLGADGTEVDRLGWGTAAAAEGSAAPAPPAGGSLERLPGRLNEAGGNGQDTDDNAHDFVLRTQAEPQSSIDDAELPSDAAPVDASSLPAEVQSSEEPGSAAVEAGAAEDALAPTSSLPLVISELLPDPASPQTDADDEFIELYNPNAVAVSADGYELRTGSSFHDSYVIHDVSVGPGEYAVLYSKTTGLAMPNSGGAVELLDPYGALLDETAAYPVAQTGQTWALFADGWQWTLATSPGAANILQVKQVSAKAASTTSTKAKAKTTKAKAAAKPKKTTTKISTTSAHLADSSALHSPSKSATWLLIVAACFTILYAFYEFRHDLHQYYVRGKRYLASRLSRR